MVGAAVREGSGEPGLYQGTIGCQQEERQSNRNGQQQEDIQKRRDGPIGFQGGRRGEGGAPDKAKSQ